MNRFTKEAFQGHAWSPAIDAFLSKGFCEVSNEYYPVVMAALERMGYETEAAKGETRATTRLYGSCFPFPPEVPELEMPISVAETILRQLGGREFITMTGSKNFVADKYSLQMKLAKNQSGANYLKITLNGKDLYDMRFFYCRDGKIKGLDELVKTVNIPGELEKLVGQGKVVEIPPVRREIARYDDVYNDMLRTLFTEVTGFDTHLPKITFSR